MSSSDHNTLGMALVQLGPDLVATALSRSRLRHVWMVEGTGKATSPTLKFSSELISEGTRMGHNTIIPPHICEGSLMKDGECTAESILAGVFIGHVKAHNYDHLPHHIHLNHHWKSGLNPNELHVGATVPLPKLPTKSTLNHST